MVAWAGENFSSTYNASRAASAFKSGAATARYEVYEDNGGSWRWRAWRSSDKVAASASRCALGGRSPTSRDPGFVDVSQGRVNVTALHPPRLSQKRTRGIFSCRR